MSNIHVDSYSFGVGRGISTEPENRDALSEVDSTAATIFPEVEIHFTSQVKNTQTLDLDKTFEPEIDDSEPGVPTKPDPADGDPSGDSMPPVEEFTMNYTKIEHTYDGAANELDQTLFSYSASNDYATATPDRDGATFDVPVADDKAVEPETDDSEPGEPSEPDPGDAGAAEGGYDLDPDDFIWDILGAPPASHGGFNMGIQFEPATEMSGMEFAAGEDLRFEPEKDIDDPNVPTEPDPGDAGGASSDGGREIYLVYEFENTSADSFDFKPSRNEHEPATISDDEALSVDLLNNVDTASRDEIPLGWTAGGIESDGHALEGDGAVIFMTDSIEAGF